MFCTECGQSVPDTANFCPACGAPVEGTGGSPDSTTASIDVGMLDPQHQLDELPELEPGTGMLVVVRGPNAGSRYLLDTEVTTVGRHPDSDIFLDDVTVSRHHATLTHTPDGIVVEDRGSLNGSYVNGARVEHRLLTTGDELQIGRFKLLFVGSGVTAPAGSSS